MARVEKLAPRSSAGKVQLPVGQCTRMRDDVLAGGVSRPAMKLVSNQLDDSLGSELSQFHRFVLGMRATSLSTGRWHGRKSITACEKGSTAKATRIRRAPNAGRSLARVTSLSLKSFPPPLRGSLSQSGPG